MGKVALPYWCQVIFGVEGFGLAWDAESIQKVALDAERLAQGQLRVFGDPPPDDGAVFGDQPGLAVVLLAVEVGLSSSEFRDGNRQTLAPFGPWARCGCTCGARTDSR